MAQRTLRNLPLSAYATPGVRSFGEIGAIADEDKDFGGLVAVRVVRTASLVKYRAPCFVHLTTKNRKAGGNVPERGTFLLLQLAVVEDRVDIVLARGLWLNDKRDFLTCNREATAIINGDPGNKKFWRSLPPHHLIVNARWQDVAGIFEIDFSIDCARDGELGADLDSKVVSAICRDVRYGPKLGRTYAKIESIAAATGKPVNRL